MRVTAWGVRGSVPRAERRFRRFGGSTSCFSVERGREMLILDAGTGLFALGERLVRERIKKIHILISHLHLDHILGLLSFGPMSDPEAEIHLYGRPGMRAELRRTLGPPIWPVTPEDLPARVVFHEVTPGVPFRPEGDIEVCAMDAVHPDGSFIFRLDADGKRIVYTLDCELDGDIEAKLSEFASGADLIIWDACFAPEDLRPGWGHSTFEEGMALARRAGADSAAMAHYSPSYDDRFLSELERRADGGCIFLKEGTVIEL